MDRGLVDLAPWFGAHVEPFRPFIETTPRFLLLEGGNMGWNLAELLTTKSRFQLVGKSTDTLLFVVDTAGR